MRNKLLIVIASSLFVALTGPPASAQDVTAEFNVAKSGLVLDRATGTFNSLVTVTNSSSAAIRGPLLLVISSIAPSGVTLANLNGNDPSGKPYINLAVPSGGLLAGQSISNVLLKFSDPKRVAFAFTTAVEMTTANLALSIPSAISYPFGGGQAPAPIVFSITNNGPFKATNVSLNLLMNPYGGPDNFQTSSAISSLGTCSYSGHIPGGMNCSLQDIAVGSIVTVSVPLQIYDTYSFTITSLLACQNCVGNVLDGSNGLYDEIMATSAVTPVYTGGPNCTTLYDGCSKMINACSGAYTNAGLSCNNQFLPCTYNGPGGVAGAACALVGFWEGTVAEYECNFLACEAQLNACGNNADNQALSCLDYAWNNCHQWGGFCNWCSPTSPAYVNDPVHRFYLGACGPNAPTQLPSIW